MTTTPDETTPQPTMVQEVVPHEKQEVGIRRVKMTISRVDPWSALKLSFLVSVAIGIMLVIATAVLWFVLDSMHVWSQIDGLLKTLNSEALLQLGQFMEFGRVMSFSVVVGVIEIVLMTAFGALMALVYNVVAMLVGGLHVTVTDE
ncbi:Transmembrane protein of unknown function [Arcanobacterium phocae]|uniref:DUF3566 domain-containing protein n=1 Tax=Arcanobacterium phocae TaxID=131112 RepID=A0A1H2LBJ4_9ACTO|nr:DUF3566 domain-containing protein [Arcanobacterium phocae]SDU78373.1 Transmembrane protein of unknown function [Arcanobacterium phocae]